MKEGSKLIHKYAFNINEAKKILSGKFVNFANLKGFYDDIEESDFNIKNKNKNLNIIKSNSVKELIYTNKKIPTVWKNKIGFHNNFLNIISKDQNLFNYLYQNDSINKFINSDDNKKSEKHLNLKTFYQTKNFELKKNVFNNKPNENNDDLNQTKKTFKSSSTKFLFCNRYKNNNNQYDSDNIKKIIEKYRKDFNLKEKFKTLIKKNIIINGNKSMDDNINKNYTKNDNENSINEENKINSNSKFPNLLHLNKKIEMRKTIYSNLIPNNSIYNNNDKINTIYKTKINIKKNNIKNSDNLFLNSNSSEFYKTIDIKNLKLKNELKSIKNFGPYYSYCPPCNYKNLYFYNSLNDKSFDIINYIKKVKNFN